MIRIHRQFLDALADLSGSEQNQVRRCVSQLMQGVDLKGLREHKVGRFWSYSATMDLRVLGWKGDGALTLVYVDHHDDAYRWAERNRPVLDDIGQLCEVTTGIFESISPSEAPNATAGNDILTIWSSSGLPDAVVRILALAQDESQLLEAVSVLAPEYQEAALSSYISVRHGLDALQPPSDVVACTDDRTLEFALRFPEAAWRVFLHPKQRFAVEMPADRHILLRGGPGTGKTVTLVHRFIRLSREDSRRRPAFIAFNGVTRDILLQQLHALDYEAEASQILTMGDLPKGRSKVQEFLSNYSCILIDEGQDMPVGFAAIILDLLGENTEALPPLFIAYDANQAITSASGDALSRLAVIFDTVRLNYCYRGTLEIVTSALRVLRSSIEQFEGKDFKHSHNIQAARDMDSRNYVSALKGPEVTSRRLSSLSKAIDDVVKQAERLASEQANGAEVAVIVASEPDVLKQIRAALDEGAEEIAARIKVFSPKDAKGREFFTGVVLDGLEYPSLQMNENRLPVTSAFYRSLLGLYVGVTRFRDRAICIYLSDHSPLASIA